MPNPYPPEFRRRALDLVASGRTVRDVAASLGIAESCLYRWKSRDLIDRGLKPGSTTTGSAELAAAQRRIQCLATTATLMFLLSHAQGGILVIVLAAASFGVMDLMLPSAWAMCMTIGGRFGGTATAVMNTLGNLGGFVCAAAFGYLVQGTGNYDLPLRCVAAMVLIAAGLFALVDCTRGHDERPESSAIVQPA